jgi:glyoxylase-like metal-dependent hydrolase (beta-lactamase superfamily II)/8-oxo-dGTP pyrophosphatase MutT (NUDIX family)
VAPGVSAPIEAASVLLARGPGSAELFLVERAAELRFFGGFCAFAGGKVGAAEVELALRYPGLTPRQGAAFRELFEETGVLLARRSDGSFPPPDPALRSFRHEVLADRLSFADLLARLELTLRPQDVRTVGVLVTPEFAPVRFDTTFFIADLPPGQDAEVWPGELARGWWTSAADALHQWNAGAILVSPPTVSLLHSIAGRPVDALPQRIRPLLDYLAQGGMEPIWFSPGVQMIPLRSHGIPPSTYTNAFLIGTGSRYLVDPAAIDPAEQQRLLNFLASPWCHGGSIRAVILSHHHPDHIAAAAICARTLGVPILGHPETARLLQGKLAVDGTLNEGASLDLGPAPHGRGNWKLEVLHTPGHAPGHLVFWQPDHRLLFAGDMVSTLSSIIIAPPEGNLTVYLDSLRRLQAYPARLLLPSHGSASSRPAHVMAEALTHRQTREEQLLQALRTGPRPLAELTLELYRGLPLPLMKWAQLQTLAGLQKLEGERRVTVEAGELWRLLG